MTESCMFKIRVIANILLRLSFFMLLASPTYTSATEAGKVTVKIGAAHVMPMKKHDSEGGDFSWGCDQRALFSLSYMATNHVGFEIITSNPVRHDLSWGKGEPNRTGTLGDVSEQPFMFLAKYHFLSSQSKSKLQPYIGGGLGYERFYHESVAVNSELGASDLHLHNAFGCVFNMGVDYAMTPRLMLTASAIYLRTESHNDANYGTGYYYGHDRELRSFNPSSVMLFIGGGYNF